MKLYLTALAAAALLFSCKRATLMDKVNQSQLKTYFTTTMIKKPNITVDSFRLVGVDTLTAENGYVFVYKRLIAILDDDKADRDEQKEKMDEARRKYSILEGNPFGAELRRGFKYDYDKAFSKFSSLVTRDSIILADADRLDTLVRNADKKQPIAYLSKSVYQIKRPDFSTSRDTAYILLNKEFNIINDKEYIKALPPFTLASGVDVTE
jgi:hypothetical protein